MQTVADTKTHRNAPCPCGSGKKYKKCCGAKIATEKTFWFKARLWLIGIVVLGALVLAIIAIVGDDESSERRVWSPEHGHWHDAR